jgi:hypothetical protein
LRPSLRGNLCRKIGELLRLQAKELISSLAGLAARPSAPWLELTTADISLRWVSRLPTTVA